MNTWTGRLSVRVASAVFAVLLISLLAVAQNSGTGERQVSGPADLADKLKRAQRLAPPSDTPIVYDAGVFACIPGQDRIAQEFVAGLVSRIQPDGGALWPVTVFESADSGETVVLNADGAIIGRMASGGGSGTGSSTAALFCMPRLPAAAAHKHEPSRVVASFLPKGAGCDASCSQIVVRHDTSVEGGVFWLEGEDVSTENHEMRHVQHALDSADAFDKLLHLFEGKCVKDKCARARGRYLEASLKFVTAVQENNDNRLEFEDYGNEYPDTGADYGDSYRELASAREVFEDAKTKMKEACK